MSSDNIPVPKIDIDEVTIRMARIKAVYDDGVTPMQDKIDKLAYLAATMEHQRDIARTEANRATEENTRTYKEGVEEGLRRFAWWKDGTQYVGTYGTSLQDAIDAVRKKD